MRTEREPVPLVDDSTVWLTMPRYEIRQRYPWAVKPLATIALPDVVGHVAVYREEDGAGVVLLIEEFEPGSTLTPVLRLDCSPYAAVMAAAAYAADRQHF